ncbi:hypothetical protein B0T44_08315 [Nocardia donostiensis]|uniref:Uncharacterized protein n=2 Tax=Nocardia donostiensis TaxID=1538463 RepID=A0A1V2TD11_9NOCA|nr:hypothetical protein B0T46_18385 [Nocardia donostiensis]OQS21127.1 hypothetical protein B0T44_08315 [Nocardia donostiensis]
MRTHWQSLKTQAENGELRLDEQVGKELMKQADQLLTRLDTMVDAAGDLEHLTGFGGLESAKALKNKFALKAKNGDDSAVKRLQESIEIVKLMRETYELSIRKLNETDQSIASQLGKTWEQ